MCFSSSRTAVYSFGFWIWFPFLDPSYISYSTFNKLLVSVRFNSSISKVERIQALNSQDYTNMKWDVSLKRCHSANSKWESLYWMVGDPDPFPHRLPVCRKLGFIAFRKKTGRFFPGKNVHILTFEGPPIISQVLSDHPVVKPSD